MTQLELFYHATNSDFDLPPMSDNPSNNVSFAMFADIAMSCPYLMNELLAFSALHLAHINPAKARFYRHQAVGLQTNALRIFNCEMTKVTEENCMAVMIFSWLMTMHTLSECKESSDTHSFLDQFLRYMHLHYQVSAVTREAWPLLLQSQMGHMILENAKVVEHTESGSHTANLKRCIRGSETLDDGEKATCEHALGRIQWFFNRIDGKVPQADLPALMFLSLVSWPVTIKRDFHRLVAESAPEALIVLSYYCIPLHMFRELWIIGNAGQLLVRNIRLHLDERWQEWLDWPEAMTSAGT